MPALERKAIAFHDGQPLQVPDLNEDDDEEPSSKTQPRGLVGPGHVRRRSSTSKVRGRRPSHGHNPSGTYPPPSVPSSSMQYSSIPPSSEASASPTITISPVQQDSQPYAPISSSFTPASPAIPISIRATSKSSSYSSSPSSFVDVWSLRPGNSPYTAHSPPSPSLSSSPSISTNIRSPSPSASFVTANSAFQGYPQPFTYPTLDDTLLPLNDNQALSQDVLEQYHFDPTAGLLDFSSELSIPSASQAQLYPSNTLPGFLGMPGGQPIPQAPYWDGRFGLRNRTAPPLIAAPPADAFDPPSFPSGSSTMSETAPFGTGFLVESTSSPDEPGEISNVALEVDPNIDDFWVQLYAPDFS
jgi:hypothetical protein